MVDSEADPFDVIQRLLQPYDQAELIAAISALQLLPRNAGRNVRLELLAHVAAATHTKGRRRIPPHELRTLCNSGPVMSVTHAEDPYDSVFAEEITFFGGSYLVLPGILEDAVFTQAHICKAMFLNRDEFPHEEFRRAARFLLRAVLKLSDELCARAGIARNPQLHGDGEVFVPPGSTLKSLQSAVRFKTAKLRELVAAWGCPPNTLDALSIDWRSIDLHSYTIEDGELLWKPIVHVGDDSIIAIPGMLLGASRNALISRALECGAQNELAGRYLAAVWDTVRESLTFAGCTQTPYRPTAPINIPCAHDGFFGIDSDKVLYCLLLTDPLAHYDSTQPNAQWTPPDLGDAIDSRIDLAKEFAFRNFLGVNDVLTLVVFQSFGGLGIIGLKENHSPIVLTSAADLKTMSLSESGRELALYKFAQCKEAIRQQAQIFSGGKLDEFALYQHFDHSFYASDEFRPNLIVIPPGESGYLRRKVFSKRDWHAVPSFTPRHIIEVTLLHDTQEVPIYAPAANPGSRVAFYVSGLPVGVWVVEPEERGAAQLRLKGEYAEFADALAYWIWQFSPVVSKALAGIRGVHETVVITLRLAPDEDWSTDSSSQMDPAPSIISDADPESATVDITLHSRITSSLSGPDNRGERDLICETLKAIRLIVPTSHQKFLSDESIAIALEKYAPLGLKKKIFYLGMHDFPELDPRELPPVRLVEHFDRNQILDELGDHFLNVLEVPIGQAPHEGITGAAREIVAFCYRKLEATVETLSPSGLLEWITGHHESKIRQASMSELTLATRIACFGDQSSVTKGFQESSSDFAEALLASRFLIEYVTARPPTGLRPISLSVYDRLLALAGLIAAYGMVGDIVYFGLAELDVSMLPSGRIGFKRDQYETAISVYQHAFAAGKVARSGSLLRTRLEETLSRDPERQQEFEDATRAEFGYSITELFDFMSYATQAWFGEQPTATVPEAEFEDTISKGLAWPLEKARGVLNLLSLRARETFLLPPPPFRKEDVYPWRFNRKLAYLRRPFLMREVETGNFEIIWGNRHVHEAMKYLAHLCMGGRLQAESPRMKAFISKINNRRGAAFNDAVADSLEKSPELIVRRRVGKVGTLRGASGPPGDIDVLAANPTTHTLWILECKKLSLARNPAEYSLQVQAFGSEQDHRSIVSKHMARVNWAKAHAAEILEWLRLSHSIEWKIQSAIIVDEPVAAPYFRSLPICVKDADAVLDLCLCGQAT